jgi:hypothetical protein
VHFSFFTHLGDETVHFFQSAEELLAFIGDAFVAFLELLRGKAQYRRADLGVIMQAVGARYPGSHFAPVSHPWREILTKRMDTDG